MMRGEGLAAPVAATGLFPGVATQMSLKIISIQAKEGVAPGHEASVAKLYGTELNQRRTALRMSVERFRPMP